MNVNCFRSKFILHFLVLVLFFSMLLPNLVFDSSNKAEAATTSFRFVVMGDSRGTVDTRINEAALRDLLTKVKGLSIQPSFILFNGDMIHGSNGTDATVVGSELDQWKSIVDDYYPMNLYYTALGNHEHIESVFSEKFNYLPNEQLSGYGRTAYYFDYGNARFITLNSDRKACVDDACTSTGYAIKADQRAWLESVLKDNGKTHNFVQFHVPAYPIGAHYGKSLDKVPDQRDAVWDIFDKYNVTAVMVGHEHNYNRRIIDSSFNASGYTFENNINQITLGGAGAPLSSNVQDSKNVVVGPVANYHYMVVDVVDGQATFTTYDINDTQIDSFTVQHTLKESYKWDNVAIGGGGYVTGMKIHPTAPDLVYTRTDVGGAYRWDALNKGWIQLMDGFGFDKKNYYSVESLNIDPSSPNTLYAAVGKVDTQPMDILKSTDRGKTWVNTGYPGRIYGNADVRWAGERLAVDPNLRDIIYFGSRRDGLWKSTTGASNGSWQQVTSFPTLGGASTVTRDGTNAVGLTFVEFDKSSGTSGNPSQILYVGVYGGSGTDGGVYRSKDAGTTWNKMSGSPQNPIQMVIASDGSLYVTHTSGVAKFKNGSWSNISPTADSFSGITVDPTNANIVMASIRKSAHNNSIYRSTDGGTTWTQINQTHTSDVPWWSPELQWAAAIASLKIDPNNPKRVWYTDWYGVWITDDITVSPSNWYTKEKGHEEIVTHALRSVPSGQVSLFSGVADISGFRHESLDYFPSLASKYPGKDAGGVQDINSLDFSEADPSFIAKVGNNKHEDTGGGQYSVDNGKTWTAFSAKPKADSRGGRIAVSATNPDHMVWLPIGDIPYKTTNRAASWTASSGMPTGTISGIWGTDKPLASDRVDGNKFYIYKAGDFYRSIDGGSSWKLITTLPKASRYFVEAAPGMNGEVWVSLDTNGLYRSSDGGSSFTKLSNVQRAHLFSFGKNKSGITSPTVFVFGTVDNVDGIFRSDDMGMTWVQINNADQLLGKSTVMQGDRQVYGQVYIGTSGRGIYYGHHADGTDGYVINNTATAPTIDASYDTIWDNANVITAANVISGTVSSTTDLNANVRALWDNSNLYLWVRVFDDYKVNDSGTAVHKDDSVEIYIDADNSKLTAYDGINDYQYIFRWNDTTVYETKLNNTAGITFAQATLTDGYRMEIQIPLSTLGVTPGSGTKIGFEVQINDDDDGGERDGKKAWWGIDDTAWSDPSKFGTAQLDSADTEAPTAPTNLRSTGNTDTTVDLAWDASTDNVGVTGYDVYNGTILAGSTSGTTFTVTGLTEAATYTFTVKAKDEAGNISAASNEVSVTTNTFNGFVINYTLLPPAIDASYDTIWSNSNVISTVNVISGIVSSDTDLNGNVRALWDNNNLYLWVRVFDDYKVNDSGTAVHKDDSIEIYIDADNSKLVEYDGINDYQYIFRWNDTTAYETKLNKTAGITFAQATLTDGYRMEIQIPWSTLGVTPGTGVKIGFEAQINDDDDGGERDGKKAWWGIDDTAWSDPSKFGTARLD
jgi:xyloglucan-specific exo-beta-1,4-glucanase